ncbi:hypothetical protein JRO89_XS03G0285400 [Xanthoceras sorbifolium]|uniref:Prolamin-like domain-containing protein n=1 Tax=Xanthoceras sorbifolium TaxID=99658 RepID=A0ABQ8ICG0_9ROSI|nr:hypothetical protein JRO89_XS03G0285400 [Xanthoceras sorbifolium]
MGGISPKIISMKLMVVCIAMLVSTGLAQLPLPLQPVPELQKCWAAITSAPGCIMEIYGSLLSGQIVSVGPVCCAAITQVSENCWPMMFPANPFFPPLLKNFCAAPSPKAAGGNAASRMALPGLLPPVNATEYAECWSSLANVKGCIAEINKSVSSGEVSGIGPACCKAVTEIKDKCWPKIFPFNPFFPPLLKSTCAKLIGAPATAPAITS